MYELNPLMSMHCEFFDDASPAWSEVLRDLQHDFHHRAEYARICAALHEGTSPRAFLAKSEAGVFFLPLLIRPLPHAPDSAPAYDASSPYGYGSPLLSVRSAEGAEAFLMQALAALRDRLAAERVVSLFVRLHPLLPLPLKPFENQGTLVEHGNTVYIDLSRSPEEIQAAMNNQTRRHLRRAKKDGLSAEVDPSWCSLDEFEEIYAQTMHRANASPDYFFDHDYFAAFRDQLGDCMHLIVVRSEGQVIAGVIYSEVSSIVQYHLGGRRDGFESHGGFRVCLDFARTWFKDRGNKWLHLGGGVGGREDSVFKFKTQFSHDRAPFHTWRLIVDPPRYRRLVAEWEHEAQTASAGLSGFFPEYRAPLPLAVE